MQSVANAEASGAVSAFGTIYQVSTNNPTARGNGSTPLVAGDLAYVVSANKLRTYNATLGAWEDAGSAVSGLRQIYQYVATAGQTLFPATGTISYDQTAGGAAISVYLNGVLLKTTDYTATNGTTVTLASGAALNDEVSIHTFGTFNAANTYSQSETNTLLAAKAPLATPTFTGGVIQVNNSGSAPSSVRLTCESNNSHYTELRAAPHAQMGGGNHTLTLPPNGGTSAGQVLITDGSGTMTWADPAGGGLVGDFVASGTIADKATVILNSDGTVTAVAGTSTTLGASADFAPNTNVNNQQMYMPVAYFDDNVNKVVVFYSDQSDNSYLKAVVGTVSGTNISFTSPTLIHGDFVQYIDCDFLNVSWGAFGMVVYKTPNNNQRLYARDIQVAANGNITVGTHTLVYSGVMSWSTVCANPVQEAFTVVYEDENNNRYGTAVAISMNSSGISGVGTPAVIWAGAMWRNKVVFASNTDTTKQGHICFSSYYVTGTGKYYLVIVPFEVTGSLSITQGTAQYSNDTALQNTDSLSKIDAVPIGNGRAVYCVTEYLNANGQYDVYAHVVEMTSKTTFTMGSGSATFSRVYQAGSDTRILWNSHINKVGITYRNSTGSQPRPTFIRYGSVTSSSLTGFSGSGITWDSHSQISANNSGGYMEDFSRHTTVHDANANKEVVAFYNNNQDGAYGQFGGEGKTVTAPSTNATDGFIGIADGAIANAATGKISVKGSLVTGLTGLTPKQDYYVQDDGSLATTVTSVKAGYALTATQMLLYGIEE